MNHSAPSSPAPASCSAPIQQSTSTIPISIQQLGLVPYRPTWQQMCDFTRSRDANTVDELWLLEHPPTYTTGIASKPEHEPHSAVGIPIERIDRGGQITYHGPGQLVAYVLLDLKRRQLGIRKLVRLLEQGVIDLLADFDISATGNPSAPGVYVGSAKIAALGLRIKNGCCYHGLALNVDLDLWPFEHINPCGYPNLSVTRMRDFGITATPDQISPLLAQHITDTLS